MTIDTHMANVAEKLKELREVIQWAQEDGFFTETIVMHGFNSDTISVSMRPIGETSPWKCVNVDLKNNLT